MNDYPDRYIVWRRSDGHVGATANRVPRSYGDLTFEVLLDTRDWPEAAALIEAERARSAAP